MKKTKIEWCDSTWNPVTGCLHGCEYCYARRIAKRFGGASETHNNECCHECQWCTGAEGKIHELDEPIYDYDMGRNAPYPYEFDPTFHKYRLSEPAHWTKPRTIFVCSMADLFGDWVPDKWIKEVFKACEVAPQHRYLFLTKNPRRYEKILGSYMPPNMWFGWSQTEPIGDKIVFTTHNSANTFVSIEPLLKPFTEFHISGISWIIVGAETGNRKNKVIPEKWWIDEICKAADKANIPVFMKDSLIPVVREENMRREFPWREREQEDEQ